MVWTLLYTHREFAAYRFGGTTEAYASAYPVYSQTAIHSIHVYEGALDASELVCRTIPFVRFIGEIGEGPPTSGDDLSILDPLDRIQPEDSMGGREKSLPPDWVRKLRYLYAEPDPRLNPGDGGDVLFYEQAFGFACPAPGAAPRLIKVTNTVPPAAEDGDEQAESLVNYTLYRWDSLGVTASDLVHSGGEERLQPRRYYADLTTLRDIYKHDRVVEVVTRLNELELSGQVWTVNDVLTGGPTMWSSSLFDDPGTLDGVDLETGEWVSLADWSRAMLRSFATAELWRWDRVDEHGGVWNDFGTSFEFERVACEFSADMADHYILSSSGPGFGGSNNNKRFALKLMTPGVHVVRGAFGDGSDESVYRIYRFRNWSESNLNLDNFNVVPWEWDAGGYDLPQRAFYHEPYRDDPACMAECSAPLAPADLSEPVWITVVDEYPSLAEMELHAGGDGDGMIWRKGAFLSMPVRRRVIAMNAAGFVLSEDVWEFQGEGVAYSRTGAREEFIFDEHGRVTEHRTLGWGCETNVDTRDSRGLIHVYEYPEVGTDEEPRFEVVRRGVRAGTQGTAVWIEERTFLQDRPDLPATTTFYGDVQGVAAYVTDHLYEFNKRPDGGDQDEDPEHWLITERTVLGPAMQVGLGSASGLYRPRESHLYSDEDGERGRLVWRVYGLEPQGADTTYETRFFDYTHYDPQGRPIREIKDAEAGGPVGRFVDMAVLRSAGNYKYFSGPEANWSSDVLVPGYPQGETRVGPGTPLHATTKHYYHAHRGRIVTEAPYGPQGQSTELGRQTRSFARYFGNLYDQHKTMTFVPFGENFDEVGWPEPTGQVTQRSSGRVDWTASVRWQFGDTFNRAFTEFVKVLDVDVELDGAGRPSKLDAVGWDGKELSVEGRTDRFGGFVRERSPEGTITRTYRDPLGRVERVFVGAVDGAAFWGYFDEGVDDLILTERVRYGVDATNYGRPVMTRRFRERPSGQYDNWNWPDEGWGRLHGYDARMREVWVRDVAVGGEVHEDGRLTGGASHRTRVTLSDNLDRVRFTIEYGADAPSGPGDSGAMTVGGHIVDGFSPLPDAQAILSDAASPPLSLSETLYNDAGLVTEQRSYDVSVPDGSAYLATVTHYDGQGRPVLQVSPNTAPVVNSYDAMGRLVRRTVVRDAAETPFWEVERTETTYDADGNALTVRTLQRLHDGDTGTELDETNSVATHRWNWYDAHGRLTASADLGSGNPSEDRYTNAGTLPDYEHHNPPVLLADGTVDRGSAPDWAILTCYRYDAQGRKWLQATQVGQVGGPDHAYRVETFQYDSLGNLIFWSENDLAGADSADKRMTAYDYELGKLVRIAAVLPGHELQTLTFTGDSGYVGDGGGGGGGDGGGGGVGYYRPDWQADDGTLQVTRVNYEGTDYVVEPSGGEVLYLGARVWTGEFDTSGSPVWSHNPSWPAAVHFPNPVTGQPAGTPDLTFTYYSDGLVRSRTDRLGREFVHHYDRDGQRVRTEILYPAGLYPDGHEPADLADLLTYSYDEHGRLVLATAGVDGDQNGSLDDPADIIISQHLHEYDARGNLVASHQSYGGAVDTDPDDGDGVSPRIDYAWEYRALGLGNSDRLTQMTYPVRAQDGTRRVIDLRYDGHNGIDDAIGRVTRVEDAASATSVAVALDYAGTSRRVGRTWRSGTPGAPADVMTQSFATTADIGYAGLDRFGRVGDLHFRLADAPGTTVHRYRYGYDAAGSRLFARVTQQGEENTRSQLHAYDALGRLRETQRGTLNAANDAIAFSQAVQASRVAWGLDRLGNWTEPAHGRAGRVEHRDDDGVPGFETVVLAEEHETDLRNEMLGIDREDDSGPSNVPHVHDAAGNLVADSEYYYQYDAFNRLAAVYELGSLTFDAAGVPDGGAPGAWRASYAYDALGRRISRQVPWAYDSDSRWTWYYHDGVRRVMEVNRDPLPQAGIGGNPEPQGSYVTYADREYVWGPDYVDECLWQVDRPGATAFVVQDANFNVVALVDPQGAVLAQYDYDPYGQPIAADNLGAFGHNRVGHQGLFADRHDTDAPAADLAVGAELLYYARNRDYSPRLGRWVQRDPNGSGTSQILLSTGRDPAGLSIDLINAESMFTDGAHLYALTQCSPTLRVDPLGAFGLIGGLMTGAQMADSALDAMDTAYTGVSLGMALMAAMHNYSVDQELDAEWATDWTQHDHMYSQSPTYQAVINSALHDDAMLPSESDEFAYGAGTRDGFIGHHVATNKGRWGARFEGLLIDHGIHDPRRLLNDIHNVVEMRARAHGRRSGRGHHDLYHSVVFRECRKAMRGKQGTAAEMAFKQTVARLGSSIRANPDLLRKPGRGRLPSRRW